MPRDIVLGNGELLINLDRFLSIRDIYYPYVGWANHVQGYRCRVGVWVEDGAFSWLNESWDWQIKYERDTLVTDCSARHEGLGIRLHINHAVLHDRNLFLQRIHVENLRDETREIRVFLAFDLRIDETDIGDTVFYNPYIEAMVHYKRDRYFLFGGRVTAGAVEDRPRTIWQYACGDKGFRGAEGAWRDAEDGLLSMNSIAQGSVDSVASYALRLPGHGSGLLQTWMAASESLAGVTGLQQEVIDLDFNELLARTRDYWRVFAGRRPDLAKLPERVAELFTRSLLIIRTQADKRGAILASNDTDIMETARAHYSYMWPRDGALVSYALDRVGLHDISRAFFEFCARVLPPDRAALMHKYGPDGSLGASWHPWILPDGACEIPFQEDGTALVVWALWQHYERVKDDEFAADLYARLIRPAADFMVSFRDPQTRLPLPSWDLWEERRGVHIFTTAAVIAALKAAGNFARLFDTPEQAHVYKAAAREMQESLLSAFWNVEEGSFARMVRFDGTDGLVRDMTTDSSLYAVFAFGVLAADDPRVVAAMQTLGRKLWVRAGGGGVARYERDYYFRVTDNFEQVPGNPWIICTLWLADWYIATAKSKDDLRSALDLLEWAAVCAPRTGILSEQIHPYTLEPLSVAPLTWSHAQFVTTAAAYLDKLAEFEK